MEKTIRFVYTWKGLKTDMKRVCKHCHLCQMSKNSGKKKLGLVPEKKGEITEWSQVNVGLLGLKAIRNKNGKDYMVHVMTIADLVKGWFELSQLNDYNHWMLGVDLVDQLIVYRHFD